jgi:ParB-like chromosome segregation protein Spo0J
VVDGHTRLKAAIEAGIPEIPVEEKEFAALEDAKLYACRRQAERRNLTPAEILAAAAELKHKDSRDGTGRASEILAKNLGISPTTVKHAQVVAQEAPAEIIDEVKNNRMTINRAYRLAKRKPDKPAKAKPERDREKPGREYDGLLVSDKGDQSTECQTEPGNGRLERLELRVHRENLNIPTGDDSRLEAARSMLQNLRAFTLPEHFIQDIHTMLQALFQENLDGETITDDPGLGIVGAEHEE